MVAPVLVLSAPPPAEDSAAAAYSRALSIRSFTLASRWLIFDLNHSVAEVWPLVEKQKHCGE
jgi:hypothetical protein